MPVYMDIHNLPGATAEELDQAHAADLKVQGKYDVEYLKYWFSESHGKAFCLVDAPNPEALQSAHREAHGQIAERIIEVDPELVEAILGGGQTDPSGAVFAPGGTGK
jgi:hypothetical protein